MLLTRESEPAAAAVRYGDGIRTVAGGGGAVVGGVGWPSFLFERKWRGEELHGF
ncbi:hypothetical protein HanIR_Chr01g0034181 [Helianthus annuus]|nr:hypothetical protein HanIR_Chr01g0034181 [Helianthus annuus]